MATALPSDASSALHAQARVDLDPNFPTRTNTGDGLVALGLLVGVATWLSITLTRSQGGASSIWIANGILLGALLLKSRADWPQLMLVAVVATVLARAAGGDSVPILLGLTGASVIEVLLIAEGI